CQVAARRPGSDPPGGRHADLTPDLARRPGTRQPSFWRPDPRAGWGSGLQTGGFVVPGLRASAGPDPRSGRFADLTPGRTPPVGPLLAGALLVGVHPLVGGLDQAEDVLRVGRDLDGADGEGDAGRQIGEL